MTPEQEAAVCKAKLQEVREQLAAVRKDRDELQDELERIPRHDYQRAIKAETEARQLTAERDEARRLLDAFDNVPALAAEVRRLVSERDKAGAELERLKEPPPDKLPDDRDGVVVAWFDLFLRHRFQTERADQAEAALDRARQVGAENHDIGPNDDAECRPGCLGCRIEHALDGSST